MRKGAFKKSNGVLFGDLINGDEGGELWVECIGYQQRAHEASTCTS